MGQERSIETTGETVEEAIAAGLAELGVSPTEVIVEVLEEPSRGVFGIGAHPARVRLQLLSVPKPPTPAPTAPPPAPEPQRPVEPPSQVSAERYERAERPQRPERREQPRRDAEQSSYDFPDDSDVDAASLMSEDYEDVAEADLDEEAQVGQTAPIG